MEESRGARDSPLRLGPSRTGSGMVRDDELGGRKPEY